MFNTRSIIILDLHKWFTWWFIFKCQTFCWWHLFSVVHDIHSSASGLNKDLETINEWAFQWKMSFNPDPNKQAQEVIFTRISKNMHHPPLIFNKSKVFQSMIQKNLGLILDSRLSFEEYLTAMGAKVSRTIALLHKFQHVLP